LLQSGVRSIGGGQLVAAAQSRIEERPAWRDKIPPGPRIVLVEGGDDQSVRAASIVRALVCKEKFEMADISRNNKLIGVGNRHRYGRVSVDHAIGDRIFTTR